MSYLYYTNFSKRWAFNKADDPGKKLTINKNRALFIPYYRVLSSRERRNTQMLKWFDVCHVREIPLYGKELGKMAYFSYIPPR